MDSNIDPVFLLRAYALGVFPMAETHDSTELYWVDPEMRGIIPLWRFHIPRKLKKKLKKNPFEVRIDYDFNAVIAACGEPTPDRPETWINNEIRDVYSRLFEMGHAHTVECWDEDGLVGGLYGVTLGAAFFGESMFTRKTDASKIALCHLVARMRASGYTLLDTQFITDHLKSFGAIEIKRRDYQALLKKAVAQPAFFNRPPHYTLDTLFLQQG